MFITQSIMREWENERTHDVKWNWSKDAEFDEIPTDIYESMNNLLR